jgi:hypothetical protein
MFDNIYKSCGSDMQTHINGILEHEIKQVEQVRKFNKYIIH